MRIVGSAFLNGPLFHLVSNDIRHFRVKFRSGVNGGFHLLIGGFRQTIFHHRIAEYVGTKDFFDICFHSRNILSIIFHDRTASGYEKKLCIIRKASENLMIHERPCSR